MSRRNFTAAPPKYEMGVGAYAIRIENLHGVLKAKAYGSNPGAAQDCANLIIAALERAVA